MYYIVYKVTNQINGKFYIGTHKTEDLNDDYMGSGTLLKRAQTKYGMQNFVKEVLFVFDNADDMFAKEAEIVTEDFLAEENTYNLKVGGLGGFDHINTNVEFRINKNQTARRITNSKHGDKLPEWGRLGGLANVKKHGVNKKFVENGRTSFKGKSHSPESKEKIGSKNSISQKGNQNSQYGTIWITDGALNKKLNKNCPIPEGWKKGRVYLRS